ncbi:MAG: prepilin-type N-terminal cleavage/methylation domain-containing protein [Desulfobulbaceae bacterium]|nr:prepilin-type N-terminal cleavage/methylation domain-containing protein [Desulfobulbaceae bacterium]
MRCADNQISNNQSGFTLIEVLIAICVLTIGILSANVMQITAISGNSTANRITESTSWASDRVESLLGLDYDDATLRDGTADGDAGLDDIGANADGNLTSPDGNYTIYWNVSVDSPFIGVKTINVIITTQEKGTTKSVTMTYIKADSV